MAQLCISIIVSVLQLYCGGVMFKVQGYNDQSICGYLLALLIVIVSMIFCNVLCGNDYQAIVHMKGILYSIRFSL